MSNKHVLSRSRALRAALLPIAAIALACNENLPIGPQNFGATLTIKVAHDTIVVGDSSAATASAADIQGRTIQALTYVWKSADSSTVGFAATATPDPTQGASRMLVAKKTGLVAVSVSLPDFRFQASPVTRTQVGVVGGVRVTTTHDSTLTSVNDTAVAIGAGLVRSNGALVPRASTGVRWNHLGTHVAIVGQGDTIRYVAKANGTDTLIATHDYCLIGAKCADTVVARVNQQLQLTVVQHNFVAFSFADSLGPAVTLADKRGNGLFNTAIQLVPLTAADSAIVKVSAPIGVTNPTTGSMAVPKLIAAGNGSARAAVRAIGSDGVSIIATDTIAMVVRQVARRVAIEPLRSLLTGLDSIPFRPVARDARGAPIGDATFATSPIGVTFNGIYAVPAVTTTATVATITAIVTGVADPVNNPGAPQVTPLSDQSQLNIILPDTAVAGTTQRTVTVAVIDSTGLPAVGKWVRFATTFGPVQDSAQTDGSGVATVLWQAPDSAANYTLTGIRSVTTPLATLADSTGRIVIRRTLTVKAALPSATKSELSINTTTVTHGTGTAIITVKVKDQFGNIVKTATNADFTLANTGAGTIGAITCTQGVCTATYTAPAAIGPESITAKIGTVSILFSPITITIN